MNQESSSRDTVGEWLVDWVRRRGKPEIFAELEAKILARERAAARAEMTPDVRARIMAELRPKVEAEVRNEMTPEVRARIIAELRPKVEAEVREAVVEIGAAIGLSVDELRSLGSIEELKARITSALAER